MKIANLMTLSYSEDLGLKRLSRYTFKIAFSLNWIIVLGSCSMINVCGRDAIRPHTIHVRLGKKVALKMTGIADI